MMDCSSEADSRTALGSHRVKKHEYIKVPENIHIDAGLFLCRKKKILLKGSHKGRETLAMLSVTRSSGPSFTVSINICLHICIHFSQRLPPNTPQLVILLLRNSRELYYKYRIPGMSKYDMREIPWELHYLQKRSQKLAHFYLQIKRRYKNNVLRKYAVVRNITVYLPVGIKVK